MRARVEMNKTAIETRGNCGTSAVMRPKDKNFNRLMIL